MPIERRVFLGGHPPSVPWDILANAYIDCVERGEPPGAVLRARYNISPQAWESKRTWMSRRGWLPRGVPKLGTAQFDPGWVRRARRMVRARIREHAQLVLERERTLQRRQQTARMAAEYEAARRADKAERRAERAERRTERTERRGDSVVLDAFL